MRCHLNIFHGYQPEVSSYATNTNKNIKLQTRCHPHSNLIYLLQHRNHDNVFVSSNMIRKIILLITLLFCTASVHAQNFSYQRDYDKILARTKIKSDSLYYPALLPLFLKNDSTLSVFKMLSLMIGYTGLPGYRPFDDIRTEKRIYTLNDSARYEEAVRLADSFLKTHPLNQTAIIEKSYAYHKLNKEDSSRYYKEQFGRIMAAMDWSGNGRSPDYAMFSIGPHDGRNFIDKYYHSEVGRDGSEEDSDGNFCDMLEMKFKRKGKTESVVFFFVIQHAVNTTAKQKP